MRDKFNRFAVLIMVIVAMFCFASCDAFDAINSALSPDSEHTTDSSTDSTIKKDNDFGNTNGFSEIKLVINKVDLGQNTSADELHLKMRESVVEVYATLSNGTSAGAGVIIGYDETEAVYLVASCHHVIEDAYSVQVRTIYGDEYNAYLVGSDPTSDICVMSVKSDKQLTCAAVGNSDELKYFDDVYAIGNPTGTLGGTVTHGIISALAREIEVEGNKMTLLQTDAAINSGNSGGGLFTTDGLLIGIVNAGATSYQGLNFAIPSNDMLNVVNSLTKTYKAGETYGYVEGRFDIECTVADKYSSSFGEVKRYVYVASVSANSSFCHLKKGDYINSVQINNDSVINITSAQQLAEVINGANLKLNDVVTFNVVRSGVVKEIKETIVQYVYNPPVAA